MVLHFWEMYVQVTQSEKSVKNVSGFHKLYENFPCVQTYKQAVYYILSASVLESFAKIVITFYQKRQVNQIKTSSFILPQIKTYCHFCPANYTAKNPGTDSLFILLNCSVCSIQTAQCVNMILISI